MTPQVGHVKSMCMASKSPRHTGQANMNGLLPGINPSTVFGTRTPTQVAPSNQVPPVKSAITLYPALTLTSTSGHFPNAKAMLTWHMLGG